MPHEVAGKTITITDTAGRTITTQVSGGQGQNQDTGKSFPACN
jgi:ribosomal protein S11